MGMSTGLLVFEILFTFVPFLLDTGIQIWNAVEVNSLTNNTEFIYPIPLYFNEDIGETFTKAPSTSAATTTTTTSTTTKSSTTREPLAEIDCEDGWIFFPHTKLCYKFHTSLVATPGRAVFLCNSTTKNPSGNLASIHDSITNDFLSTIKNDSVPAFIGGYRDASSNWDWGMWFDQTPWNYTNWGTGQPSNRSGEFFLLMEGSYTKTNGQEWKNGQIVELVDKWKNGQWNDVSNNVARSVPSLCQYDPNFTNLSEPIPPISILQPIISRRKREAKNKNIYRFDFSIKVTVEGLISLALVQLPGIVLGFLGILKAFINHGCSKQTIIDSLR